MFLASPDAQEVMWVSQSELADLTDVTLVSDDTFRRLYWWSDGDGDGDGDGNGDGDGDGFGDDADDDDYDELRVKLQEIYVLSSTIVAVILFGVIFGILLTSLGLNTQIGNALKHLMGFLS